MMKKHLTANGGDGEQEVQEIKESKVDLQMERAEGVPNYRE